MVLDLFFVSTFGFVKAGQSVDLALYVLAT